MGQLTKQFGKIKVEVEIPHLLNLQVDSYRKFMQEGRTERLPDEGLEGVFRSVFPIEDFNRTASLEFVSYEVGEPKYDQAECISKGLTYESPVRIKVRLVVYDVDDETEARTVRDIKEQDIYFGTLPLMTEKASSSSTTAARRIPAARCSTPAVSSPCAVRGSTLTSTTRTSSTCASTAAARCPPRSCSKPWA